MANTVSIWHDRTCRELVFYGPPTIPLPTAMKLKSQLLTEWLGDIAKVKAGYRGLLKVVVPLAVGDDHRGWLAFDRCWRCRLASLPRIGRWNL